MKVWVSVYQYSGVIHEILAFKDKESAKKRFEEFIEDCGGLNENDVDEYNYSNGDDGVFYFYDGIDNEIMIEEVDVK